LELVDVLEARNSLEKASAALGGYDTSEKRRLVGES
jgi:hypothetical protein